MNAARVLRWSVPVDDRPHEIGGGPVLHVDVTGNGGPDRLQVWTQERVDDHWPATAPLNPPRYVQVVGTGHPHPEDWEPLGTTIAPPFVWHLMQVTPGEDPHR